ncbi:predicted protein [Scheffersomyces stipitis CBS 6054]|uniref:Uncharacterized protein n=1 Tax=Scheffersomyces stipitis (strain ATCC 58785 / CBS 6054 / NBRC 10063 / NRRL Y-11545) TaxID=322104 RepID=A3M0B7_PICST|nr:predicted protein [Scheffersomyces stipitis CBS 6054]ABN68685.1 predicted protein [Scheffersomyces stipitis CBS 6054]KAG2731046.1 hypothetical protein G9P44_006195 [Scheffersomyces stipitis]
MSNILNVFNPPPSRPLTEDEIGEGCIPCTAVQSVVALAGGVYLNSNTLFKDPKTGKIDFAKNPIWWQKTVKGFGIVLFGLGAYRAGEVGQLVWKKKFE